MILPQTTSNISGGRMAEKGAEEDIKRVLKDVVKNKKLPGLPKGELKEELRKRTNLSPGEIDLEVGFVERRQDKNSEIKVMKIGGKLRIFYLRELIDAYVEFLEVETSELQQNK